MQQVKEDENKVMNDEEVKGCVCWFNCWTITSVAMIIILIFVTISGYNNYNSYVGEKSVILSTIYTASCPPKMSGWKTCYYGSINVKSTIVNSTMACFWSGTSGQPDIHDTYAELGRILAIDFGAKWFDAKIDIDPMYYKMSDPSNCKKSLVLSAGTKAAIAFICIFATSVLCFMIILCRSIRNKVISNNNILQAPLVNNANPV